MKLISWDNFSIKITALRFLLLLGILSIGLTRVFADIEIDLGDNNPTPVPQASNPQQTPVSQTKTAASVATSTPVPESNTGQEMTAEESSSGGETAVENEGTAENQTEENQTVENQANENQTKSTAEKNPTLESAPIILQTHGILKMRDVYQAGMKAYGEKNYEKAIRFLKQSLKMHDRYSRKFYYAEANAMLGIIYQFYFPVEGHYHTAYIYYKAALKYERRNPTALRHLKEVRRYR